jgi:hypothetical protein
MKANDQAIKNKQVIEMDIETINQISIDEINACPGPQQRDVPFTPVDETSSK